MDPIVLVGGAALAWSSWQDYTGPGVDVGDGKGTLVNKPSQRGTVITLTADQRVARWRYLAGELPLSSLDGAIVRGSAPPSTMCADIFYRLKDHNGGKDPTAIDCADRWTKDGGAFVNRTSDCIGAAAWGAGFDRYQPARFPLYSGWINTDSMIADAEGARRCFHVIDKPEPGCFVVARSGSYGPGSVGHIGGVISVPSGFRTDDRASWAALGVVDVAARNGRANKRTTGAGWYGRGVFVLSHMK